MLVVCVLGVVGIFLGLRFNVLFLLIALGMSLSVVFALDLARGADAATLVLDQVVAGTALQIGYLGGVIILASLEGIGSPAEKGSFAKIIGSPRSQFNGLE